MRCILLTPDARKGRDWRCAIENLGEDWRCIQALHAAQAVEWLQDYAEVLLLADCGESRELLRSLTAAPLLAPPWVLGIGWDAPDGCVPCPEELGSALEKLRLAGEVPALSAWWRARVEALAAALFRSLEVPARLRAWEFLPEMAALTVTHPPLVNDLSHGLYPIIARRHGMTAAGVERSLRLCVESTWVNGSIGAMERFFGSSVDPERGKPTNREFLCRVQERLALTANRLL